MIMAMSELRHSIKVVSKLTGLSPHVIRVWERRYGAVTPSRTGTNRRSYSEAEVRRLALLHRATLAGHSICNIAKLPTERLEQVCAGSSVSSGVEPKRKPDTSEMVAESLEAIRDLNAKGFQEVLSRAVVSLGQHGLLEKVVSPVARKLGELWREGSLTAAHEHFASGLIRGFLGRHSLAYTSGANAPVLVVATPAGQLHELGAVMVAAAANDVGWRVIYLGTSLPAAEISGAAVQNQARAVALSLVYPEDDPALPGELEMLRAYLPAQTRLIVGGRASESYGAVLKRIGAIRTGELGDLYSHLDMLRRAGVSEA